MDVCTPTCPRLGPTAEKCYIVHRKTHRCGEMCIEELYPRCVFDHLCYVYLPYMRLNLFNLLSVMLQFG